MRPDVPEETRIEDLRMMTERSNHKSAIKEPNASELVEKFRKGVVQGFLIPFSVASITKIKHLFYHPTWLPQTMVS